MLCYSEYTLRAPPGNPNLITSDNNGILHAQICHRHTASGRSRQSVQWSVFPDPRWRQNPACGELSGHPGRAECPAARPGTDLALGRKPDTQPDTLMTIPDQITETKTTRPSQTTSTKCQYQEAASKPKWLSAVKCPLAMRISIMTSIKVPSITWAPWKPVSMKKVLP